MTNIGFLLFLFALCGCAVVVTTLIGGLWFICFYLQPGRHPPIKRMPFYREQFEKDRDPTNILDDDLPPIKKIYEQQQMRNNHPKNGQSKTHSCHQY
ncbi:unnamed protein product [Didymodactylos carnosus]|uniref:Uncharacterized protein n=1 Tax=Didymodactylos carnosus TaxID=1234261 RepID=A0A813PU19_9BILA|nr:unnamed protein product [Didymodactylos carnosus]CAF1472465.1 unnamed protein product [Didymodactylos carnosus]CAF3539579.1 unnamed protein product [Didymodactylos carnosus]CAF4263961.1 unnamed protein product [Didymodactylos carnosus]